MLTTAIPVGGHRVVTLNTAGNVIYADSSDLSLKGSVIGVTTGAAAIWCQVEVQFAGFIEDPSFSFASHSTVWLSTNGVLSNTPPTSNYCRIIGIADTPTKLFLDIRDPVLLI